MGYNWTALCNLVLTSGVVVLAAIGLQKIMDFVIRGLNMLYASLFELREVIL